MKRELKLAQRLNGFFLIRVTHRFPMKRELKRVPLTLAQIIVIQLHTGSR